MGAQSGGGLGLIGRLAARLDRALGVLAGALLFAMMVITVIDVVGRYVFNKPVAGGFEITELMMAGLIFAGLPLVTARDQHVTIDIFQSIVPKRFQRWQTTAIHLLCAVCLAGIAWRLWVKAGQAFSYGDTTATLRLPLAPLAYFMCFQAAITAVIFAVKTIFAASAGRPEPRDFA